MIIYLEMVPDTCWYVEDALSREEFVSRIKALVEVRPEKQRGGHPSIIPPMLTHSPEIDDSRALADN